MWRPLVEIDVPGVVEAGGTLAVVVRVTTTAACEVRSLVVSLLQLEHPRSGRRNGLLLRHPLAQQETRIEARKEPGTFGVTTSFVVPLAAPPTYDGFSLDLSYEVVAEVSLPLRLDGRAAVPFRVVPSRAAKPLPVTPALRVLPDPKGPFLEVGLASSSSAPGRTFRGAVALSRAVSGGHLELNLVGFEGTLEAHRHTVYVGVPALPRGEAFRFTVEVPRAFAPSIHSPVVTLWWWLTAAFDGDDLKLAAEGIPVTIAATPPETTTAEVIVGTARWDALFPEAARQTGLAADGRVLSGACGPASLRLRDDPGGIGCELVWEPVDLELRLRRERTWGFRKMTVEARFAEHVKAIEGDAALVSMLQRFDELSLDDRGGTLVLAENPLVPGRLAEAHRHIKALVDLLQQRISALPLPPGTDGKGDLLRELSHGVGGRFSPGALSIRGADLDGEPFAIVPRWTGRIMAGLRVEVPLAGPLVSAHSLAAAVARFPPARTLRDPGVPREIDGSLIVDVPFVQPTRGVLDHVRYLHAIARDLGGVTSRGPYR